MKSNSYFENEFGFGFKTEKFIAFFGNTKTELTNLNALFSSFTFSRIKQTHSDIVVEANASVSNANLTEADAHWTAVANQALVIATADCMPIMIYCNQTHRVAAVHAGWRGIENRITEKTLQSLIKTGSTQKNFKIYIGPSIQQASFEVDVDVYEKLSKSAVNLKETDYSYQANDKYYINLNKIVLSQINSVADSKCEVYFCEIDTKTDLNFYSYRRGKLKSERNLSFISLV